MRRFARQRRPLVTATLVCAALCGVAVVATGGAAAVPPKCWGYHQPPCYYDVRIETTYTNGEFVLGTFRGTVSARTTATFRRVPLQTIWRRGQPNVWIGEGKLVSGRPLVGTPARGTLRATVSADVRRAEAGTPPCTIHSSYQRPVRLRVTGFRGVRVNRGTFSLSYDLAQPLSAGCPGSPVRLHHLVSGVRRADEPLAPNGISLGGDGGALGWEYFQSIESPRAPVPAWDRLFGGRSYGFTRTYTGPGQPTFGEGSFGTSQSAVVRVTFKRVR